MKNCNSYQSFQQLLIFCLALLTSSTGIPAEDDGEAWEHAGDYAEENPVIAIAIYGPESDDSVLEAQKALEGWFAQKKIPVKTFFGINKEGGFGAAYYLKGLQFGPTAINAEVAVPKMEEAARLFSGAWPDYAAKHGID